MPIDITMKPILLLVTTVICYTLTMGKGALLSPNVYAMLDLGITDTALETPSMMRCRCWPLSSSAVGKLAVC